MKSRRRGRGRRSAWNWAITGTLEYQDTTAMAEGFVVSGPLLPAPRVDWLLESGRGRDSLTVTTILLWLDFFWANPEGSPGVALPVDFWLIKERFDSAPGTNQYAPYEGPQVPASLTSWAVDDPIEEFDGLDPFLWTHHLSELVAGCVPGGGISANASNASQVIAGAALIQPMNNVRAAWQPDVVVKTRRRLGKGDCLNIGFSAAKSSTTLGNNLIYNLAYRARVLTT